MTATEADAREDGFRLRTYPELRGRMDRFCREVLDMIIAKTDYQKIEGLRADLIKEAINAAEDER